MPTNVIHYYKDNTASGANNGTSPADAWYGVDAAGEWQPNLTTGYPDADVYVWYRRNQVWDGWANYDNYRGPQHREVHVCWPLPTDPFYDRRPAAGISAGWDADPAVRPTFGNSSGDTNFIYSTSCYGLRFYGVNGQQNTSVSQSPGGFWGCTFEAPTWAEAGFAPLRLIELSGYYNSMNMDAYVFRDCTFHPLGFNASVGPAGTNGEEVLELPAGNNGSYQFTNCTFDQWHVNNTSNDIHAQGALIRIHREEDFLSWRDITFLGCTFPNIVSNVFSGNGWELIKTYGHMYRNTIKFVGCDFQGGSLMIHRMLPQTDTDT